MPFFKKDTDQLHHAPSFVHGSGFSLTEETHGDHEYPVEGWYWFENLDAAIAFFATKDPIAGRIRISGRQGKKLLLRSPITVNGSQTNMLAVVEAYIAGISDPDARKEAEIEFSAPNWESDNPFLLQMWTGLLGGDQKSLNQAFQQALLL